MRGDQDRLLSRNLWCVVCLLQIRVLFFLHQLSVFPPQKNTLASGKNAASVLLRVLQSSSAMSTSTVTTRNWSSGDCMHYRASLTWLPASWTFRAETSFLKSKRTFSAFGNIVRWEMGWEDKQSIPVILCWVCPPCSKKMHNQLLRFRQILGVLWWLRDGSK